MMRVIIIFTCLLGSSTADRFFDSKLYHDVLDPDLCAQQFQNIDNVFYDSSFRVPNGILGGNFIHMGNYYQCLAINQDFPGSNIEGKYCMIRAHLTAIPTLKIPTLESKSEKDNFTWSEWKFNWSKNDIFKVLSHPDGILVTSTNASDPVIESLTLLLGVCVPKSCTVEALLRPYAEHPLINFKYSELFCRLPGDKPFDSVDYVVFAALSLLVLLTAISTAYELRHIFIMKNDPEGASELFRAFSLYHNTVRLFTFDDNPRTLDCLDGIRTLSLLRVLMYHSCQALLKCSTNKLEIMKGYYELKYLWVFAASTAVDTFFVLTGLLLVYTTTYKMKKKSLLRNLHLFYMNRYVRLFPLLAGLLMVQVSLLHHVADGPFWYFLTNEVAKCRNYWWSTLLYVQNFINTKSTCVGPTWYLSVDMQLYVVSPLVLYWVLGSARAAWTALTAAVLASLIATLAICFHFNFDTSWWAYNSIHYEFWYYKNTISRSPPFFIGMLFGYVLHVFRGKTVYLPKWRVFLGHTLALVLSFYAFYVVHPTMQPDWDNQPVLNVYNALFRSCWALATCWLIFACVHGYGGPVNWFLSLKLWRFPARISYSMYLYSTPVQFALGGSAVQTCYFTTHTLLATFFADMSYSVVLAVAACIVIEAPVITLYQLLLKVNNSRKKFKLQS